MLFKRFAELDFRGPTPKSSKVDSSASLFKWVLDRNAQHWIGMLSRRWARAVLPRYSVSGSRGRETFAYLSFQFLLRYACHFFEAIFFF